MTGSENSREISAEIFKRKTRRSFLTLLGGFFLGGIGWIWARTRSKQFDLPWPFRRILGINEKVWRAYYRSDRNAVEKAPAPGTEPRVNGDLGLNSDVDDSWRLNAENLTLSLEQIKQLPRTEGTCLFKCIEGWSETMSYAGVRFSDFAEIHGLGKRSDGTLYSYVGLRTPDGEYYVSIDRESMWHPATVLAYEMNGRPLSEDNGAPLRLMIPVKYGIKNLKRIGTIFFSDTRPPDYWHEQGYDWFAGL
jgi:Oxidoreductase molybdopterin binding domain